MNKPAKPINIIDSFFKSKRKVKKLYELYRYNFPEQQNLWKTLIKKKSGQLKILKGLLPKFNGADDFFKANEYSKEIIGYIENFIDQELELVKFKRTTPKQALATAIRLELSMIEKKSCEILMPLSAQLESTFKKISQDCGHHISFLTKALNKTAS